jgi:hypothetical protein
MWAAGRGPDWPLAVLCWIATIGFVVAGFRLMLWPVPRLHPVVLAFGAATASLALLPFVGVGPVTLVGAALDIGLLLLVMRLTRAAPVYAPAGELLRGEPPVRQRRRRGRRRVAMAFVTILLAYLSASILLRPWHTAWGTTAYERAASLPGDELVPGARYVMNHAVRIDAPVEAVWPWLVQIGQNRGGFYSYDWLERAFGDDIHNADVIVPEWQELRAGDLVRATQPDYLGGVLGELGWRVARIDSGRALVLRNWGAFVLHRVNERTTVLQVRTLGDGTPALGAVPLGPIGMFVFEPAHFIMERAMLLGIKARAERLAGAP